MTSQIFRWGIGALMAFVINSAAQANPLLDAAAIGNIDEVRHHLEQGIDANTIDEDRFSSLHWAAFGGYTAMVKLLVEKGASIDVKNDDGLTPLHTAVLAGQPHIVRQLLAFGADASITTRDGNTARDMALIRGRVALVDIFDEQMTLARHQTQPSSRPTPDKTATPVQKTSPSDQPGKQRQSLTTAAAAKAEVKTVSQPSQPPAAAPPAESGTKLAAVAPLPQTPKAKAQPKTVSPAKGSEPKAAPSTETTGQFAIQLAALRSESEAQQEWTRFQRSFPELLGQSKLLLQHVELAERGTFYRIRTGPFASRDQATTLCGKLKTKRQDCMVVSLQP